MSSSRHPITYYFCNKFVLTEDGSYFFPYRREFSFPPMRDILQEIFDLEDPEVYKEVEGRFSEGRIIVGEYFPSTKEIIIQFPKESDEYVEKRIKEVFGQ